ncbi:cell envelope integrity protein TolA [Aquimonas sp.]|jgi:colicin import membrane protein|uniref:cell envelope integrity protein TolA n=1 Tax=Aquimonas sp. TaxID=1872588 RepID=UPI0037C084F6
METQQDKLISLTLAAGLHLALFALLFVGALWHTPAESPSVRGEPIMATLVMGGAQPTTSTPRRPAPQAERVTAPAPQPTPTPSPQTAEAPPQPTPQAPVEQPDTEDQERAARNAQSALEQAAEEQREKQRQEQILLEQQAEQEAQRLQRLREQQDREREAELDKIRQQREAADRQLQIEREKLQQLDDLRNAQTRPGNSEQTQQATQNVNEVGNRGTDESLLGRYQIAIQQVVQRNWLRPDTAQPGIRCTIDIVQIPGGEVISASVASPCNADELTRRSIEAAVMKAQPLPYDGFQSVFQRQIRFTFRHDGQ